MTMKLILTCFIIPFSSMLLGQQLTLDQWDEEAKNNIRLLPKYGNAQKTEQQKQYDQEFIETSLKKDTTNRKASDHLVELGFKYLYKDIKIAMYRFNQAYLLDSTNSDIYWGYGGVYMTLGDHKRAEEQYKEGLEIDPDNTHILTDYGTLYLTKYYLTSEIDRKIAQSHMDKAIEYMIRSFEIDPKDENTNFKLSVCYYIKNDCNNAWKYYDQCVLHGGAPITKDYTDELTKTCIRKQ